MKYSQFNSIIPYGNQFALYNTRENKVIFLELKLKDILLQNIQTGIDKLEALHPAFFEYLTENQFLVANERNEVEEIKNLSRQVDENKEKYELIINPTINCNFRCWYCYETHEQSKMNVETVKRVNKFIQKTLQNDDVKIFSIGFFGGEPLLYFEKVVVPIINKTVELSQKYNKELSIGFTTNGSLINENFLNFLIVKQIKPHFHITLDGYREKHDQVRFISKTKGSYFTIINNIKRLVENEMFVRLRINYTDENVEDTYKIANDLLIIEDKALLKDYLLVDFHRVWQNTKIDDIDIIVDRNVGRIKEKGFMAKNSNYCFESVRGSCYADKRNSSVINYNGDVYKCTARDFKPENREGYLSEDGEIIWENNSLEKRMNAKFHNKPCLVCKLLAICNGCCSQQAIEHSGKGDYCILAFNEKEKDKVIRTRVDLILDENETK